jgi:peptidyl-prolyl cis-trans isomerase C
MNRFMPHLHIWFLFGFFGASQLIFVAGCSPKNQEQPKSGPASSATAGAEGDGRNLVVATVGRTKITVGSLSDELNKQNPYVRMRFNSLERKREFLKNLVRFEVLAQEARHRNLQRDPEVVRRVKRVMIDRLMEELQGSLVKMSDISDQEVADYYQANASLYHQEAKVRVSQIVLASKAEAQRVLALAKKKPNDVRYFGGLVQQYSIDAASKAKQGDLNFLARDSAGPPKEILEAAFAINGMWQFADPVQTSAGWVVLMKTGEIAAVNRPLEMEKDRIRNRLYNEKKIKVIEAFIEELKTKAKVTIDEANLAKVTLDLAPPHPAGLNAPRVLAPQPGPEKGAALPGHGPLQPSER